MTEDTNESALGAEGSSQPSGQATSTSGQQPLSGDTVLQQRLEELNKTVKGLSAELNTLKSGKDRGINDTRKELKDLKASVGEIERVMKERGVGVGEALDVIEGYKAEDEFRDNVRELAKYLRGGNPLPGGNGAVDVSKVISDIGLDPTSPEVVAAFAGKQFSDPRDAKLLAMELKIGQATKPQPSSADAASMPTRTPTPQTAEGLRQNYIKDAQAARGNRTALIAIQEKYKSQGLNIGAIDLAKELKF